MRFILRGRRSFCWSCRVTHVAPRIVSDVSHVRTINHESDFSWQGQHFLEGGLWLFVAGAAFRNILGNSRSAKCCIFQNKITSKIGRVRSPKRRVWDDDFIVGLSSDHGRMVFILAEAIQGFCAEILNSEFRGRRRTWWVWRVTFSWSATFEIWCGSIMRFVFRGRRNICWRWRVTLVAPRIVNDASNVRWIDHEIHFAWQARYLL